VPPMAVVDLGPQPEVAVTLHTVDKR